MFSNHGTACMNFCISCKQKVSHQRGKACDISVCLSACKRSCTDCRQRDTSRMLQYVFLDIISLDAWIVALVTTEMPLPWMCWHVLFEVAPLCEGRGTMGAFKGLLPWISEGWVWFNPCSTVDHWYTCTLKVVPSYRVYFCQKIKKAHGKINKRNKNVSRTGLVQASYRRLVQAPGKKAGPWRLLGAWGLFFTLAP